MFRRRENKCTDLKTGRYNGDEQRVYPAAPGFPERSAGLQPGGFRIDRRNANRHYTREMFARVFDVATIEERFIGQKKLDTKPYLASLGMTTRGDLQSEGAKRKSGGIKPPLH